MNPARSVPGAQDTAVPAVGADIVGLFSVGAAAQTAKDCAGGTVPGLRPSAIYLRFSRWAVPAQATEAVCPPAPPVFVGVWEPKVSQPLYRQSPPPPHTSRPPPWPRSTRFARSAPYGTGRLTDAPQDHRTNQSLCETASTIGPP